VGFLNRLGKIAKGFGGALYAPVGLVKDVAFEIIPGEQDDDELDGFIGAIFQHGLNRGGDWLGNVVGPEGGWGSVIGGLPEGPRQFPGRALGGAMDAAEFAYREGVSEPLSTVFTMSSLMGKHGPGVYLEGDRWQEAYRIAQDRSPGEAFGIATLAPGKDPSDPKTQAQLDGTPAFEVMSSVQDATIRFGLDPLTVVGKGLKLAKFASKMPVLAADEAEQVARLGTKATKAAAKAAEKGTPQAARKAERATEQFDQIKASRDRLVEKRLAKYEDPKTLRAKRLDNFVKATFDGDKDAAQIRDQFFPGDPNGADISALIAEAGDFKTRRQVVKGLMGDRKAVESLYEQRADVAAKIERATAWRNTLIDLRHGGLNVEDDILRRAEREVHGLYDDQVRMQRAQDMFEKHPLLFTPRVSRTRAATTGLIRTNWYQNSRLARPARVILTGQLPHHFVNYHDPKSDAHIHRLLRQSYLPIEEQDELRSAYINAALPPQRQQVHQQIEQRVMESIADKTGMSVDDLQRGVDAMTNGQARAAAVIKGRTYSGTGRDIVKFLDDSGTFNEVHLPMTVTQEANIVPVIPIRQVKRAATRLGRLRTRFPDTPSPDDALTAFYSVWRPAALLRGGWPQRVVGDEQGRIMAKIGALTQVKNLGGAAARNVSERLEQLPDTYKLVKQIPEKGFRQARGEMRQMHQLRGVGELNINGHMVEDAFGRTGEARNIYSNLLEARPDWNKLAGNLERMELEEFRRLGEWTVLDPTNADHALGYGPAWERVVNLHLGQDEVAGRLLRGESQEDVVRWLRHDPEGQAHAARMGMSRPIQSIEADYMEEWVEKLAQDIDDYTLGDESLRQLAAQGKATIADLERIAPEPSTRPNIYGEMVLQDTRKSRVSRWWTKKIDKAFQVLGATPTNVLSRNRYFEHLYRAEMKRLVNLHEAQNGVMDAKAIERMQKASRDFALIETKDLLYDLAETTEFTEMMRNVIPFYGAWQEVLTRWAGIAAENPAVVGRIRTIWSAPDRAGLITDEAGTEVEFGNSTGRNPLVPEWGDTVPLGKERYITFNIPEWAQKGIPGLRFGDQVKFNKKSFNLVSNGPPSVGPPVQILVNEVVKDNPTLEESVKFMLPFGTSNDIMEIILPSAYKRAYGLAEGEESREFAFQRLKIMQTLAVEMDEGRRPKVTGEKLYDMATQEARKMQMLRVFANFTAPAAPSFQFPYQTYVSAFREAQRRYSEEAKLNQGPPMALADEHGTSRTPDEWFYDKFGKEFFALTERMTKSVDGVPPTREGEALRKKHVDLIEEFPELGGLIVGRDGAGEFSGAVYDSQLSTPVKPGSRLTQRLQKSMEEFDEGPEVRKAWIEYTRAMDMIEAERIARDLPSLQVAEARDLAYMKRAVVEKLEQEYPEWAESRATVDNEKWGRRIEGMRRIASDPVLSQRPEIEALTTYFEARDIITNELAQRDAKTLSAVANQDLADLWNAIKGQLVESNLAFSQLYYRWLERDPLEVETPLEEMLVGSGGSSAYKTPLSSGASSSRGYKTPLSQ
jgi:hypothetical protein